MNLVNRSSKFALWGGLLLTPFLAQASLVTINLGQTAQNITLNGTGPNASSLGTYLITLGTCTPGASTTTCILTGAFTSRHSGPYIRHLYRDHCL